MRISSGLLVAQVRRSSLSRLFVSLSQGNNVKGEESFALRTLASTPAEAVERRQYGSTVPALHQ